MPRRLLKLALGAVASGALFLLTLEVLLTAWPSLLPPRLGNHAFSKYGTFPGGIYYFDLDSRMHFMTGDFSTRAYFNGYTWQHTTDSLGFRNPPDLADRSILLLGDSLIYGHGVEQEATAAHQLRVEHGRPAYNMGRQGDCLYQNYILLRLQLDRLQPETVILFVFLNDFNDLWFYRTPEEIASRDELHWDYDEMSVRLAEREAHRPRSPKRWILGLKGARLLRGAWNDFQANAASVGLIATAEAVEEPIEKLPYLEALIDPAIFDQVADYYRVMLADLKLRLERRNVDLRVVHLDVRPQLGPRGQRALDRLDGFLDELSVELDLQFASTRQAFEGCDECILPQDGHLSRQGNRRLAAFVDQMLAGPTAPPIAADDAR